MPPSSTTALPADLTEAVRLHQAGDLAGAELRYRRVLMASAGHFDACHMLGVLLLQRGDAEPGIELLRRAVHARPRAAPAWFNLGLGLHQLRQYEESLAAFERAAELDPAEADVHRNCARQLVELGHHAPALARLDRALVLQPGFAAAHSDRSDALRTLNRHGEAIEAAQRALSLQPSMAEAWCNLALARMELGHLEQAQSDLARACELAPQLAVVQWNTALCLLMAGQYEIGWRQFEWRWLGPRRHAVRYAGYPRWDGTQPVAGKTVLLHAEQGLGDTIQFCRYAPMLADLGARVVLEVHAPLVGLMRSLRGIERVIALEEAPGAFDLQCPLLSVPLAFGTRLQTVPAGTPYLAADPASTDQWRRRYPPTRKPRIGLAVSGNLVPDPRRSIPLTELAPLLSAGEFFLLQPQCGEADEQFLRSRAALRDTRGHLVDFADTAALIDTLDLVISIDTAVAHLAGALNKPLWLLLPFAPDWRWMRNRDDNAWYPSARLFRQPAPGDWGRVIQRVEQALAGFACL